MTDHEKADQKKLLIEIMQEDEKNGMYEERKQADRDQFAMEFADYMNTESWEHDYREQKTHTMREHLEYFKARYYPA